MDKALHDTTGSAGSPPALAGSKKLAPPLDGRLRERELNRVRPVTELALPKKAVNALLRGGVNSVAQLISRSKAELLTEIVGLGEETVKAIETALAKENLTLAPTEVPSSAFTQISIRRALSRGKTGRHIKNHNAWANSTKPPPIG